MVSTLLDDCPACGDPLNDHREWAGDYLIAAACTTCGCRWALEGTGWLD